MATDRAIIKDRLAGQAQAFGLAADAKTAISNIHTRSRDVVKTGTENAETNVAETPMFVVNRAAVVKAVKFTPASNVASNATNYVYMVVSKSTAGAASVPVAYWNTAVGANGAMTKWVAASFTVVPNADAAITANDALTYTVTKFSAGKLIDPAAFTVDLEEV